MDDEFDRTADQPYRDDPLTRDSGIPHDTAPLASVFSIEPHEEDELGRGFQDEHESMPLGRPTSSPRSIRWRRYIVIGLITLLVVGVIIGLGANRGGNSDGKAKSGLVSQSTPAPVATQPTVSPPTVSPPTVPPPTAPSIPPPSPATPEIPLNPSMSAAPSTFPSMFPSAPPSAVPSAIPSEWPTDTGGSGNFVPP